MGLQEVWHEVVFRSAHSLRSMLFKVKDPLVEKQAKVTYRIPCTCGKAFLGETVRRLEARVKEHKDTCQIGALEKLALAEQTWKNHHPIKWEEVSVVGCGHPHPTESPFPQQGWGPGAAWMLDSGITEHKKKN